MNEGGITNLVTPEGWVTSESVREGNLLAALPPQPGIASTHKEKDKKRVFRLLCGEALTQTFFPRRNT